MFSLFLLLVIVGTVVYVVKVRPQQAARRDREGLVRTLMAEVEQPPDPQCPRCGGQGIREERPGVWDICYCIKTNRG